MNRAELEREASSAGYDAVRGVRWEWNWKEKVWTRCGIPAQDGRCPDCGDELGHEGVTARDGCRCSCERKIYRSTFLEFVEEFRERTAAVEWERVQVPERYRQARFSNFEAREGTQTARARCESWADAFERNHTDRGLFLVGPFGSGKSHLAVAAAQRAQECTLVRPRFVSAAALLQEVKGGDKLDMTPVRNAIAAELLILDDIGQVGRTDFDRELMFSIVAERYDHRRPMIVSSNLPADRLGDLLGGALASRLHEACELLVLTASDYRKELGKRKGAA